MFPLPDEVIYELMDDDAFDRNNEALAMEQYADENDGSKSLKTVRTRPFKTVACGTCGFAGLLEKRTKHGWRLVYSDEAKVAKSLVGQIHACHE